jgi:hypothetical protein
VLAVDVRGTGTGTDAASFPVATADAAGVRALRPAPLGTVLRDLAARRHGVAPLAVVVVHPATRDADAVARAADAVGAAVGGAVGDVAAEWPWPVPLDALEAAAWRALEYGLLPERGRAVVVDPLTGEAGVVDREHDRLAATGRALALRTPDAGAEALVALARQALDAAPPGPPFAGVVVGGDDGSGGTSLAGVIARVSGRPPVVPGDPATVALLGAASLGWAAGTASEGVPRPARTVPRAPVAGDDGNRSGGGVPRPATGDGRLGGGQVGPAAGPRAALPGGSGRRPLPRWARWALPLAALALVAVVAGLLVHRERTEPSPFTFVCPNGEVVAFDYECARLAPSTPSP